MPLILKNILKLSENYFDLSAYDINYFTICQMLSIKIIIKNQIFLLMRGSRLKVKMNASEQQPNLEQDGRLLMIAALQNAELKKVTQFRSKLNFDYSLRVINKEKFFGNLIPLSSRIYPQTSNEGSKFLSTQYSSAKVRQNRRRFQAMRYRDRISPQFTQQIKHYRNIISKEKAKLQSGGIQSFWLFKKQVKEVQRKKAKIALNVALEGQENPESEQQQVNKTEQAYLHLCAYGKQPLDTANSLISRIVIKNYLTKVFGQNFALRFLNFYQIKSYINFKEFESLCDKFTNIKARQSHLVSFFLYDQTNDGFICPKDVFNVFQRQLSIKIQKDISKIVNFVTNNVGKDLQWNKDVQHKIENVVIRDDWLTIKDYQMYFKKIDEPYLKATNKKDTVFSKSFAVIDHRQKIRSTRKQMTQKKNMYNQLFGAITKQRKNWAFIDKEEYKLNFSTFYQIFGDEKSELFKYFIGYMFGI